MKTIIKRLIRGIDERFLNQKIYLTTLKLTNRYSNKPILSQEGLPVSLTSYGKRVDSVFYTIESIARGNVLPSRLILWLDEKDRYDNLPDSLVRLKKRGLEVRLCENYGPHKKYYPYVLAHHADGLPLITADDDAFYPIYWLQVLRDAYRKNPSVITCYRGWVVGLNAELTQIAPYDNWEPCYDSRARFNHFAVGVSGVLYPADFLRHLFRAGDGFKDLCPRADDIWLHVNALRSGYKIQRLVDYPLHFQAVPSTQDSSLFQTNVTEGQNDKQIAKTYQPEDIAVLRDERLSEAG
jgi:hypothetical protein